MPVIHLFAVSDAHLFFFQGTPWSVSCPCRPAGLPAHRGRRPLKHAFSCRGISEADTAHEPIRPRNPKTEVSGGAPDTWR